MGNLVWEDNTPLKIGDLVETCNYLPGFVTNFDGEGSDGVSVFIPGVHKHWKGGHHSIYHCGVRKISEEYAMKLFVIGEDRLSELYDKGVTTGLTWEEVVNQEYEELKNEKYDLMDLEEQIDWCIKQSGYYVKDGPKDNIVKALNSLIEKYKNE